MQAIDTGCFAKPIPPNCGFFPRTTIRDEFTGKDHECFFFEDRGKDYNEQWGKRWRVVFYYASNFALTKFFTSEEQKDRFLAKLKVGAA